MKSIKIGNKNISESDLYFVADIGANHNGSIEKAIDLIHLAKKAGANAAKFQNFKASKIVSQVGFEKLSNRLSHQSKWKKSVYEVYEDASISDEWTKILKKTCVQVDIDYFTSPYDFESVDAVDPYVDLYKIGSGDISWPDIIHHIAQKGKPILIATGASEMSDVERAMDILLKYTKDIVLMQCNTNYTGNVDNFHYCNLNVLKTFAEKYPEVILGLSDHTSGHATVLGSIALGARVFEKHFTDDNNQEGPDHSFAMNPTTWREMVDRSNELLQALGDGIKRVEENEMQSVVVQRRSLRSAKDLAQGEILSKQDIVALRPIPEDGIAPYNLDILVGKRLKMNIQKGEHFTRNHINI
jgi:sialic acid synthase SpsE